MKMNLIIISTFCLAILPAKGFAASNENLIKESSTSKTEKEIDYIRQALLGNKKHIDEVNKEIDRLLSQKQGQSKLENDQSSTGTLANKETQKQTEETLYRELLGEFDSDNLVDLEELKMLDKKSFAFNEYSKKDKNELNKLIQENFSDLTAEEEAKELADLRNLEDSVNVEQAARKKKSVKRRARLKRSRNKKKGQTNYRSI